MPVKRKVVNCDGDEFESFSAAARYCGVYNTAIHNAVKYGQKVNGLRWRYSDQEFVEPKKIFKRILIREDGREFESLTAAAKEMQCTKNALYKAAKNATKCKGFKFRYKESRVFNQDVIIGELWKQHPELPIKTSDHGRIHNSRRITHGCDMNEYKQATILSKTYYVHRLVAETFISNPDSLPQVDHIDGNKSNNKVSNLRWCTQKQNSNWYLENKKEE